MVGSPIASGSTYRAAADVTALIAAGGAGPYAVADVQVATGPGAFGSWALLVVFKDPGAPRRMIAVANEFTVVEADQAATIAIGGLPAAPGAATVTFVATEGDLGLRGGERPQVIVPRHCWQTAKSLGDWTLVGCTVAPGFQFSGFEMAKKDWEPGK